MPCSCPCCLRHVHCPNLNHACALDAGGHFQPVGRPQRGKKQLRFDEAERFITAAFPLFDEQGDAMALAAVTALLLGCRAGEVLHLRVRDLDCSGTKLWVAARDSDYRGKTQSAARDPDVPDCQGS